MFGLSIGGGPLIVASFTTALFSAALNEELAKLIPDGKVRSVLLFIDASAGVAYKFDFDAFKLAVGAGFYYNILMSSLKLTGTGEPEIVDVTKLSTIGLSSLIEAKYMITDTIGVCLTAMPQIGFYSNRKISSYKGGEKIVDNSLVGFGLSFTMPSLQGTEALLCSSRTPVLPEYPQEGRPGPCSTSPLRVTRLPGTDRKPGRTRASCGMNPMHVSKVMSWDHMSCHR